MGYQVIETEYRPRPRGSGRPRRSPAAGGPTDRAIVLPTISGAEEGSMKGVKLAGLIAVGAWAAIAVLHLWLNFDWSALRVGGRGGRTFTVAFIPVT
jgi:hypothetical protein